MASTLPPPLPGPPQVIISILLSKQDLAKLDLSNIELFSAPRHHSAMTHTASGDGDRPSPCIYISRDVDLSSTDITIPILKSQAVVEAEDQTSTDQATVMKKKAMSMDEFTLASQIIQEITHEPSYKKAQDDSGISKAARSNGVRAKATLCPLEIHPSEKQDIEQPVMQVLSDSLSRVTEEAKIDLKASPAAKFLLQVMPWELTPSPLTPGVMSAVPFRWEDAPGKPKLPPPLPSPFPTLQLPPRLLIVPSNELPQKRSSDKDSPLSTLTKAETSSSSSTPSNPSDLASVEDKFQKDPQRTSSYVSAYAVDLPYHGDSNSAQGNNNAVGGTKSSSKATGGSIFRVKKLSLERKWMHWITKSKKKKKNKCVHHGSSASLLGNEEDQGGENGAIGKKPEISLNSKIAAAMDAKASAIQPSREFSAKKPQKRDVAQSLEEIQPARIDEPRQLRARQKRSKWGFIRFRRTSRFFVAFFRALRRSIIPRKSSRRKLLSDSKVQYRSLQ